MTGEVNFSELIDSWNFKEDRDEDEFPNISLKGKSCEGYYNEMNGDYGCGYSTNITCEDCVFVVGKYSKDKRKGKRPFAKVNLL